MPESLEKCVASLQAKWSKDPKSRPTPKKDKDGKPQRASQQAHAICTASLQKAGKMEDELTAIALEGAGMTLMGLAVTNRPHLKGLPAVKIVKKEVEGEERELLRIPLLLQGIWRHSKGNLVFNSKVFGRLQKNLKDGVIGQDVCIDSRHNPDWGALGWIGPEFAGTGLKEEDDILVAYAEATPIGKEKVEQKAFRYASAELNTNFHHPKIGSKFEAAKLSTDDIEPLLLSELAEEDTTDTTISLEDFIGHIADLSDDELVKLYNPYHDKLGRFASKAGGIARGAGRLAKKGAKRAAVAVSPPRKRKEFKEAVGRGRVAAKKAAKFSGKVGRVSAAAFGATPQGKVAKVAGRLIAKSTKQRARFAKWAGSKAFRAAKFGAKTTWRATRFAGKMGHGAAKSGYKAAKAQQKGSLKIAKGATKGVYKAGKGVAKRHPVVKATKAAIAKEK